MFIELKNRQCLVVGGGRVALRKVKVLRDFGADILVTAPVILPEIISVKGVRCVEKCFEPEDVRGKDLVVAATDDADLNHQVSAACQREKIPVNAVDQTKDCSFIFPAYLKEGEVVAAFSSGGLSPVMTQYLKEQMRPVMTPFLGELASHLGGIRELVRRHTDTEGERKEIYRELLRLALKAGTVPGENDIEEIIKKYSSL